MKKSDLISGKHVVEMRNGKRRLFLGETFMNKSEWNTIGSYHDNLKNCHVDEWDIVKVFEITNFKSGFKELLEHRDLKLIWERKAELNEAELENQELIRLAKLGEALEMAYSKGAILIYDIKEDRKGEIWYCNRIKTLEEVLGWID